MKPLPHLILEVANTHNGNAELVKKIVTKFAGLKYENLGIKFQAFKFDRIALPDYKWYGDYKRFFIDKEEWKKIIELAHKKIGKVWLDIFCTYGVEIADENKNKIFGLKLQASVLSNHEVISALKKMNLRSKELLLNISGYDISDIGKIMDNFATVGFKKTILQLGFQNYPTRIEDSSLSKIDTLQSSFPKMDISYADHISAEEEFSTIFPSFAYLKGCAYMEKHICLERKRTKFDHFSALEYKEIKETLCRIETVSKCFQDNFLIGSEKKYLRTTVQKPILKVDLNKGALVSETDCVYRRTAQNGLDALELGRLQNKFYILKRDINKHQPLYRKDFRKARIAVIVAGRMKSSRLKRKALLPIGGVSSLERCLGNCVKMRFADEVILATSNLAEDEILKKHTLKGKVRFWQGDPDDVMSRFLGACDKYKIDVVIRVTADCPFISPEITDIELKAHFNNGADYTAAKKSAIGTAPEVYNVEALKRIIRHFGKASHSEFMTWYMRNNPKFFKLNIVDLPKNLVRNYRLTLDYKEDLDMFNALFKKLKKEQLELNVENIFSILDKNPDIAAMNAKSPLIYRTDKDLINRLNEATKIKI